MLMSVQISLGCLYTYVANHASLPSTSRYLPNMSLYRRTVLQMINLIHEGQHSVRLLYITVMRLDLTLDNLTAALRDALATVFEIVCIAIAPTSVVE